MDVILSIDGYRREWNDVVAGFRLFLHRVLFGFLVLCVSSKFEIRFYRWLLSDCSLARGPGVIVSDIQCTDHLSKPKLGKRFALMTGKDQRSFSMICTLLLLYCVV